MLKIIKLMQNLNLKDNFFIKNARSVRSGKNISHVDVGKNSKEFDTNSPNLKFLYRYAKNRKVDFFPNHQKKNVLISALGLSFFVPMTGLLLKNKAYMENNPVADRDIAIRSGDFNKIKAMYQKDKYILEQKNNSGLTALLMAAQYNQFEMLKWLIETVNVATDVKDNVGDGVFLLAVYAGNIECMKYLVAKKIATGKEENNRGENATSYAAQKGHTKVLQWLLEDLKISASSRHHLLLTTAIYGRIETAEYLLNKDSSSINIYNTDGNYALILAIENGQEKYAEWMIKNYGRQVANQHNNDSDYALHYAIDKGNLNLVELLVKAGADVNANKGQHAKKHETPLHRAIKLGRLDIIKYLISHKATLNRPNELWMWWEDCPNKKNILSIAVQYGHLHVVEWLIDSKTAEINKAEPGGETALMIAIASKNTNIINLLLERGADLTHIPEQKDQKINDIINNHKMWRAIASRNISQINELKNNHPRLLTLKDKNGNSLLHLSIVNGGIYIPGVDILAINNEGQTALHMVVMQGDQAILKHLMQKVKEQHKSEAVSQFLNKGDLSHKTALHLACESGKDIDTVTILIDEKAQLSAKNINGDTPIHLAAVNGHHLIVKKIIEADANANKERNNDERTPLAVAVYNGRKTVIDVFKEKKLFENEVESKDKEGNTLMHLAVMGGHLGLVETLLNSRRVYFSTQSNNEGLLPVHIAAQRGRKDFLQEFQRNNVNLESKSKDNRTPLHYATMAGQIEIVQWLMEQPNINPEPVDSKNKKPIEYTSDARIIEIFRRNPKKKHKSKITTSHPVKNLVFQGGGVKGFSYLGALEELEQNGLTLRDVEQVAGTSAGAITAVLLGLGLDIDELKEEISNLDFTDFLDSSKNISHGEIEKLKKEYTGWCDRIWTVYNSDIIKMLNEVTQNFGIYDGKKFLEWINGIIDKRISNLGLDIKNLTFAELHELKEKHKDLGLKDIYIVGCNLTTRQVEEFSYRNELTKDMVIADAVRISMSIPIIFKPHQAYKKNSMGDRVLMSNDLYVDGALVNNYPIGIFDKGRDNKNPETRGLRLISSTYTNQPKEKEQVSGLLEFLNNLVVLIYKSQEHYYESDNRTIAIETMDIKAYDFSMKDNCKELLRLKGKEAVRKFVRENNGIYVNSKTSLEQLADIGIKSGELFNINTAEGIFSLFDSATDNEIEALQKLNLNLNVPDENSNTALHIAVQNNREGCLNRLLQCGGDAVKNTKNNEGKSPLDIAFEKQHTYLILSLIRAGHYECQKPNELSDRLGKLKKTIIPQEKISLQILKDNFDKYHQIDRKHILSIHEQTVWAKLWGRHSKTSIVNAKQDEKASMSSKGIVHRYN